MSIMSLLSIEKTREECFVLVGGVNCFGVIVPSSMCFSEKNKGNGNGAIMIGLGYLFL